MEEVVLRFDGTRLWHQRREHCLFVAVGALRLPSQLCPFGYVIESHRSPDRSWVGFRRIGSKHGDAG